METVTLCATVLCVVSSSVATAVARSADPVIYVFPDATTGSHQALAVRTYESVIREVDTVFEQQEGQPQVQFPDDKLSVLRQSLQKIIQEYPNDVIRPFAERRLILLEWLAGAADGERTCERLLNLATADKDPRSASFTRAFAVTVLAREQQMDKACSAFQDLECSRTPHFGWFAFEIIKYYGGYVSQLTPQHEDESFESKLKEHYQIKTQLADWVESVYIPKINEYIAGSADYSGIERDNIPVALRRAAEEVRRVLGPRIHLDLSRRCSDHTLPQILKTWQDSLELLEHEGCIEKADYHRSRISVYSESIIPRLHELQEAQEFRKQFGPYSGLTEEEMLAPLLDTEETPSVGSENALEPNNGLTKPAVGPQPMPSPPAQLPAPRQRSRLMHIILPGSLTVLLIAVLTILFRKRLLVGGKK